jgi:murein DD-endopeptidase MepM/ murein hydrolase activator NlpD
VPQSGVAVSSLVVSENIPKNVIILEQSADTYQWPLKAFGISQGFSLVHPGMDLTDPVGTAIYPIADGTIGWVRHIPFGYGSHVFVVHDNGTQSLYAHMSRVDVTQGQRVTKETQLGLVGVTGWTTGSHLHVEVYQNSVPTNPLEVLPEIRHETGALSLNQ